MALTILTKPTHWPDVALTECAQACAMSTETTRRVCPTCGTGHMVLVVRERLRTWVCSNVACDNVDDVTPIVYGAPKAKAP